MTQTTTPTDNPFDGWTTIEDAALSMGLQNTTIRRWANAGRIRSYPIGRRTRVVNIEEVRNFARGRVPMNDDDENTVYSRKPIKRKRLVDRHDLIGEKLG